MRFQSTFRLPTVGKRLRLMRPTRKTAQVRTKPLSRSSLSMEEVLEACAKLPSLSGDATALRQHIAESAKDIFQAVLAGMMVRHGESYLPGAICTDVDEPAGSKALLEHARSFATQAIEQKRLLNFHFSFRSQEG